MKIPLAAENFFDSSTSTFYCYLLTLFLHQSRNIYQLLAICNRHWHASCDFRGCTMSQTGREPCTIPFSTRFPFSVQHICFVSIAYRSFIKCVFQWSIMTKYHCWPLWGSLDRKWRHDSIPWLRFCMVVRWNFSSLTLQKLFEVIALAGIRGIWD